MPALSLLQFDIFRLCSTSTQLIAGTTLTSSTHSLATSIICKHTQSQGRDTQRRSEIGAQRSNTDISCTS